MAGNMAKVPLLRTVATRSFASATNLVPIGGTSDYEVTNSKVNGVLVASAENNSSLTRVSIIFRAGSRQETSDNQGVSHVLRICAGLSTKSASQFAITRHIQQLGASLHCTSDRETIAYTLEGTRSAVEQVLPFLSAVATEQVFKPWELSDNVGRLRLELATRPPQLRTVDLLHKAAYRTGLGNSLFVPKYNLGKIGTETLQHYVNCNLTSDKATVVGLGCSSNDLKEYVESLKFPGSSGQSLNPSPYKGGEVRCDKGGNLAYVAIAGEGSGLNNLKEAAACAVLQKVLGTGSQVPYGQNHGLLGTSIKAEEYAISGLSASYGDTGLVGAIFVAPSRDAGQIAECVVSALKSGRVSEEWVTKGKNQLKASVLLASESGRSAVRKIGQTGALTGTGLSPSQYLAVVESVTAQDVNNVLSKAGKNLSIASFGNLTCVPYLVDLK
ncbi:hypothetical protein HHI36_019368 [Cryptolaemus montrouzieri]|uniref:Cytochrome b-c1 complex subunit 2, mitochondrial n=1 Tax=Cryptolaemus montrouzieri TaxID=559131 RepID=A0ABD2P318_9CUCU